MSPETGENIKSDPREVEAAEKEAQTETTPAYTHHFKKPFEYNGVKYDELHFRFDNLTGADSLAVEAELQAKGIMLVAPTFNGAYLVRIASRACEEPIGSDGFERMKISDFERIRSRTRNFLMASES